MTLTALALAALGWVIVAVLVGLALAQAIQLRERQVPVALDEKRTNRVRPTETGDLVRAHRAADRRPPLPGERDHPDR